MTPFIEEQDIQPMIDGLGVDATIGSVTAKVLLDRPSRELLPREAQAVQSRVVKLTAKSGTFPALAIGVSVQIKTTTLRAYYTRTIRDGAVTEIYCQVV